MNVKGTAVKSIKEFVHDNWPTRYNEWTDSLPNDAKNIMNSAIFATRWYSVKEGIIEPTKALGMFYHGDTKKAAWESGRYSAEKGLSGVYRIFVKMSNPGYLINRGSKAMETYYENAILKVVSRSKTNILVHIERFSEVDQVIEYRIGGWIEKALELSGCKNLKIDITKSLSKGDNQTEYKISWT